MSAFLQRLNRLNDALAQARSNADPEAALQLLGSQLGPDF
jgi:hypothetical protein